MASVINLTPQKNITPKVTPPLNLYGLPLEEMIAFCTTLGEKPYRAKQIMKWLYHKGVGSIDEMTDISKLSREKLKAVASLKLPEVLWDKPSKDGTRKWLIRMDEGNAIEMVFIPEEERGTLCISSQVGCALDCSFCATGKQGFNRNLSAAEIVGQVLLAKKLLGDFDVEGHFTPRKLTNIVFMGMGEPLLNYRNVVAAGKILLDDLGFGFSKRRVTLSTSGVVPALRRLKDDLDLALAVSLHAPNDALRDQLVPINQKYPLEVLLEACRHYIEGTTKKITWEYVMLHEVNDSEEEAHQLAKRIRSIPGKINLIPFNPFPEVDYQTSHESRINRFRDILIHYGLVVTVRKTRGNDIDAACGQLAGRVLDKTKRNQKPVMNQKEGIAPSQTKKRPKKAPVMLSL